MQARALVREGPPGEELPPTPHQSLQNRAGQSCGQTSCLDLDMVQSCWQRGSGVRLHSFQLCTAVMGSRLCYAQLVNGVITLGRLSRPALVVVKCTLCGVISANSLA
jgi:hypothetical protein